MSGSTESVQNYNNFVVAIQAGDPDITLIDIATFRLYTSAEVPVSISEQDGERVGLNEAQQAKLAAAVRFNCYITGAMHLDLLTDDELQKEVAESLARNRALRAPSVRSPYDVWMILRDAFSAYFTTYLDCFDPKKEDRESSAISIDQQSMDNMSIDNYALSPLGSCEYSDAHIADRVVSVSRSLDALRDDLLRRTESSADDSYFPKQFLSDLKATNTDLSRSTVYLHVGEHGEQGFRFLTTMADKLKTHFWVTLHLIDRLSGADEHLFNLLVEILNGNHVINAGFFSASAMLSAMGVNLRPVLRDEDSEDFPEQQRVGLHVRTCEGGLELRTAMRAKLVNRTCDDRAPEGIVELDTRFLVFPGNGGPAGRDNVKVAPGVWVDKHKVRIYHESMQPLIEPDVYYNKQDKVLPAWGIFRRHSIVSQQLPQWAILIQRLFEFSNERKMQKRDKVLTEFCNTLFGEDFQRKHFMHFLYMIWRLLPDRELIKADLTVLDELLGIVSAHLPGFDSDFALMMRTYADMFSHQIWVYTPAGKENAFHVTRYGKPSESRFALLKDEQGSYAPMVDLTIQREIPFTLLSSMLTADETHQRAAKLILQRQGAFSLFQSLHKLMRVYEACDHPITLHKFKQSFSEWGMDFYFVVMSTMNRFLNAGINGDEASQRICRMILSDLGYDADTLAKGYRRVELWARSRANTGLSNASRESFHESRASMVVSPQLPILFSVENDGLIQKDNVQFPVWATHFAAVMPLGFGELCWRQRYVRAHHPFSGKNPLALISLDPGEPFLEKIISPLYLLTDDVEKRLSREQKLAYHLMLWLTLSPEQGRAHFLFHMKGMARHIPAIGQRVIECLSRAEALRSKPTQLLISLVTNSGFVSCGSWGEPGAWDAVGPLDGGKGGYHFHYAGENLYLRELPYAFNGELKDAIDQIIDGELGLDAKTARVAFNEIMQLQNTLLSPRVLEYLGEAFGRAKQSRAQGVLAFQSKFQREYFQDPFELCHIQDAGNEFVFKSPEVSRRLVLILLLIEFGQRDHTSLIDTFVDDFCFYALNNNLSRIAIQLLGRLKGEGIVGRILERCFLGLNDSVTSVSDWHLDIVIETLNLLNRAGQFEEVADKVQRCFKEAKKGPAYWKGILVVIALQTGAYHKKMQKALIGAFTDTTLGLRSQVLGALAVYHKEAHDGDSLLLRCLIDVIEGDKISKPMKLLMAAHVLSLDVDRTQLPLIRRTLLTCGLGADVDLPIQILTMLILQDILPPTFALLQQFRERVLSTSAPHKPDEQAAHQWGMYRCAMLSLQAKLVQEPGAVVTAAISTSCDL